MQRARRARVSSRSVSCGGDSIGGLAVVSAALELLAERAHAVCELLSPSERWGGVRRDTAALQRASGAHFSSDCACRSLKRRQCYRRFKLLQFSDQWRGPLFSIVPHARANQVQWD